MVMQLPMPAICSLQLVDDVVLERQGGVNAPLFNAVAAEWRARVATYLASGGSPALVPTWPQIEPHKSTFQNLFKSPAKGSAHAAALRALRDHALDTCPACGEGVIPKTLDHYLPKGRFPHLSITPANLTPMCFACQLAKGEKTGDATTPRYFIHPYFDTFSEPQVLKLSVTPPFSQPTFVLFANPALTEVERVLVESHLRELKVHERYITFFRNQHRRLLRQVSKMRDSGQDVVGTLTTFAFGYEAPTPNRWEHVFYEAVLSNPDFVTYLTEAELPPLL